MRVPAENALSALICSCGADVVMTEVTNLKAASQRIVVPLNEGLKIRALSEKSNFRKNVSLSNKPSGQSSEIEAETITVRVKFRRKGDEEFVCRESSNTKREYDECSI